jgi:beta-lactamase class A
MTGGAAAIAVGLSAQSFASAREAATTYQVQAGETLIGIASATGVPLDKLIGINGLSNPDRIAAGQVLQLVGPAAGPTQGQAPPSGSYTVKAGDTLWDISKATGVPLDSLISLNDLDNPDSLVVGQQLKLSAITGPSGAVRSAGAPGGLTMAAQQTTALPADKDKDRKAAIRASNTQALQQKAIAEARRVGGPNVRIGIAAKNLVSGATIAVNAGDEFPSASVMKLPILLELERQAGNGQKPWTDALRAQVNAMITISDNYAADQIVKALGFQPINDTLSRIGLGGTHLRNLFADTRSAQNPGFNDTTPIDMAKLLELIATDQVLTPQATADMRSLLARNTDRSKLVRLLPGDARVMHKSGWYDGVANDVGIVNVDRTGAKWVIAVFTQNVPDAETGNQIVAAVSKAVYDAWAGADGG